MTRMSKLDRMLRLVHLLHDTSEGLTLDEMAAHLEVNRRTVERMRDMILVNFDLEEIAEDRVKRWRIRDSLRRVYTRPTAAEVAALQAEADARTIERAPRAAQLASLLAKVKGALDDREMRRIDVDLEPLVRLQRTMVTAGPVAAPAPETLAALQQAIIAGQALEFDYVTEDAEAPRWRRVVPYGLVHGAVTYLVGKMPGRDLPPVYYRLDRMADARAANLTASPPEDWDLDAWIAQSFGIWREEDCDVVLRILPAGVKRARAWRFHPGQRVEEGDGGTLVIRFRAGGLREICEHLFTWAGEVVIEGPEQLNAMMRERLDLAAGCVRPDVSQANATSLAQQQGLSA